MAGLALHLSEDDMPPMGKEYVIGLSVNPFPGDFLFFLTELSDFLFLRILCNGLFVHLRMAPWHAEKIWVL
jgi:hypothetical protein